ncbi:MAG TPA: DUF1206 domain-containing protein [Solirubrobacteraceae bacterium]|nr:DUF1206 domain-containing protein [Solirubrobacteraceae bacterium]
MQWLVRVGFLARGVTYGLIGALAIALAIGAGTDGTAPNQAGALALVARAPLGFVALTVIAAGLLAYSAWKFMQAIRGRGPEGGGGSSAFDRVANGAGGVAYLIFCAVAVRILAGNAGGGSSGSPKHAAAGVLGWPAGRWLVGAAGVALIAVSIYQAYDAVSGHFTRQVKTDEMARQQRQLFCAVGRVGLIARSLVFAICAYFLLRTAITYDPASAVGVDGALLRLHHQALGPWMVGLVGVGLVLFAGFSLFEGRYRRL